MPKRQTKKLAKSQPKELDTAKKDIEQFKRNSLKGFYYDQDPEKIAEAGSKLLRKYKDSDGEADEETITELNEHGRKYINAHSLDTDMIPLECMSYGFGGFAITTLKELRAQYNIETPQDKMYLHMAVNAMVRYHSNLKEMECWKSPRYLSHECNGLITALSKDADRAFRQYHTIIQHFEAKQQPPLKVNIKAKNAFVAQNQQNIASVNPEINDPQ